MKIRKFKIDPICIDNKIKEKQNKSDISRNNITSNINNNSKDK